MHEANSATPVRRRPKLLPALAWTAAILVVGNVALFMVGVTTRVERTEVCVTCGSRRTSLLRGLSADGEHGLSLRAEKVVGSGTLDEIYGGAHDHSWGLSHEEHYTGFAKNLQVCGNPLGNPIPHVYEHDGNFRAAIGTRLADGRLLRQDLIAYMAIPDLRRRQATPDSRTPDYRDRLRRALALARECGATGEYGYAFAGWEAELK